MCVISYYFTIKVQQSGLLTCITKIPSPEAGECIKRY